MLRLFYFAIFLLNLSKGEAFNHQFSLTAPVQFIDYQINKRTMGMEFHYQILIKENFAPGLQIGYHSGINSKQDVVPLYNIFIIKPTLSYYFRSNFNRFFFELGIGYAIIKEAKTILPINIYIPFTDQFHYSIGLGYNIPIKRTRIGFKSEIGGYSKLNNTAPTALFIKGVLMISYCIIKK